MSTEAARLRPALLLGALTVLVAAYASLLFTETAAIKVAIPPQRLEANVAFNTAAAGGIAIQHLAVDVTDTAQGTASAVTIAPAFATGQVTFVYACPAIQPCPTYTLPAGTVVATTRGHLRFATLSPVALGAGPRPSVAVRALAVGAASNVGPANINVIENSPIPPLVARVFNPYATSGGVDGRVTQIVQQSDVDAVQAALAARVGDELRSAMSARAQGMTYLVDASPSTSFTSDHAVGDEAPTFIVTLTGKEGARAFSNSAAQEILRPVLQLLVWPGYQLSDPILADYQLQSGEGTNLVVTAHALAFAMPKLLSETEGTRLKGLGLADAYARLRQDFPGSSADIRTSPLALPWLPLAGDHINLTVTVAAAAKG
jgi:hypothetical protein